MTKHNHIDTGLFNRKTFSSLPEEFSPCEDNIDHYPLARQFLKIERWAGKPHIRERAIALRTWSWLRIKIGNEKTEKLAKIIWYLWKNPKTRIETDEEKDRSKKLVQFHVLSNEENRKEINTILKESSKIDFSKPEK
jgi:hypothetical protein